MTTEQDQANALREQFDRRVQTARNDTALTLEGKRIAISKAYIATSEQLQSLADQQQGGVKAKREALERAVLGLPANPTSTDVISFRDAADRVAAIDPLDEQAVRKLEALLESTELSGDKILARAVLARAFDTNNVDLINEYIENYPADEPAIVELWTQRNQARASFVADWIFLLPKPAEIDSLSDLQIAAYAQATIATV